MKWFDKKEFEDLGRESIIYLILLDVFILYIVAFFGDKNLLVLLLISVKSLFDYLLVFFLWSKERKEEYSPNNRNSGILEFTFLYLIEYVFSILAIFSKNINLFQCIVSYVIILMLVFLIRYKYIMNQEYKGNVLLEDVKTIIPLASLCGLVTVIFVLCSKLDIYISLIITIYSVILLILIWFYSVSCINNKHGNYVDIKSGSVYIFVLGIVQIIALVYWCMFVLHEKFWLRILLSGIVLLSLILLNFILIYKLNKLIE